MSRGDKESPIWQNRFDIEVHLLYLSSSWRPVLWDVDAYFRSEEEVLAKSWRLGRRDERRLSNKDFS